MADHSQKWHDWSNSRKVSNGSSDRIAAIANKLDSLGYDMKKLKENMHAMQVEQLTKDYQAKDANEVPNSSIRSLCYPTNNREVLGKMKLKADIGIFIGYSKSYKAMASKHNYLEPGTNCFQDTDSSAEDTSIPSKEDLDNLFGLMYKEYFEKRSPEVSINSTAQTTPNNQDTPS
ncbi:hypothetical protein Tco_0359487 [Tanacetum coccineum]